jgi:hypothetical protein
MHGQWYKISPQHWIWRNVNKPISGIYLRARQSCRNLSRMVQKTSWTGWSNNDWCWFCILTKKQGEEITWNFLPGWSTLRRCRLVLIICMLYIVMGTFGIIFTTTTQNEEKLPVDHVVVVTLSMETKVCLISIFVVFHVGRESVFLFILIQSFSLNLD